jgi:hypothetical protein
MDNGCDPNIQTIDADSNVPMFYTNIASISATPEEFSMHFGIRKKKDPNHGIGVAMIYMSLPHAKRLAEAMAKAIHSHEQTFGEIITDPANRLTGEGRKLLSNEKLQPEMK